MTRQMKKAVYEAPLTEHFQVELEGVFCGSVETSYENSRTQEIDPHSIASSTEFNASFATGGWEDIN